MSWQGVVLELQAPCAEGNMHPVRLRITGWGEYELVDNPCVELLGEGSTRMAPCSHYLQGRKWWTEDRDLRLRTVKELSQAGAPAVPVLLQALGGWIWTCSSGGVLGLGRNRRPASHPRAGESCPY